MTTTPAGTSTAGPTIDHHDPEARLYALFDAGTLGPTMRPDSSGVRWARGEIDGTPAIAYAAGGATADDAAAGGAMPGGAAAGGAIPGSAAPDGATTGGATAGGAALGGAIPGGATAGGAIPGSAAPDGATAGGAAPGGAAAGGALGVEGCRHIVDAIDTAVRERVPVLGVWHSGGAWLPEGVPALDGIGTVFAAMVRASGRIPQLSVVLGAAAGGAAYGPALTDIVITSGDGDAHITAANDGSALEAARALAVLLGRQGRLSVADVTGGVDPGALLPAGTTRAYDVRPLVDAVLDAPGVELHGRWAPNIVTTLGRLGGRTVGVIANNPRHLGGRLDPAAAEKAARFVRMCDSLGVPLVVLVDVPDHLPGADQDGAVRRGAKLLHAFAEAVVPRVTLITRKAYGAAYLAMNSKALGATAVLAWPHAEIAVMGAVTILHRRRLAAAAPGEREALRTELAEEQTRASGVDRALEIGVVDAVVQPKDSRRRIAEAIAAAPAARGAHSNIPL